MVELRVVGDAQALSPGLDGAPRIMVPATVTSFRQGAGSAQSTSAEVLLIESVDQTVDSLETFRAGHRYRGQVRLSETDPGERATAMVFPLMEDALRPLPVDRRTQLTEVFNGLRAATRDASSGAIGEAPALLPGLIMGDRSLQSEDLTQAMRDSGMSHLTVVSGTHCALVMGALMGGVRLLRTPRWAAVPVAIGGLVLYVMLVHPAPSVIRAAVMGGLGALAMFAGRRRASFSLLCVCVLALLIYDPWFAVEPAFQLSVAATAGIVLIGSHLQTFLGRFLPGIVAAPLALAFSAQLFVTPVLLPLNGGVNTYAVLANVLGTPLLPLITVPGTLAATISTTLPWLASALLWASGVAAAAIGVIGRTAADMPRAVAPWPDGTAGVLLVGLYLAAAVVLAQMTIMGSRPRRLRAGRSAPAPLRLLPFPKPLLLAGASGAVLAMIVPGHGIFSTGPDASWRVAMCDVGQGDMIVVRTGEEAGIVVDTGEEPASADACLRSLGVEDIDVLMITHEHLDHYGGTPGVTRGREVGQILYSGSADWVPAEEPALQEAVAAAPLRRGEKGDSGVSEGEFAVRWQVWLAEERHQNPNDNSLVVHFEIIDPQRRPGEWGSKQDPVRLLTTGDLEEDVTRSVLRRGGLPDHVDVLKVAHHGAANGGVDLLEQSRPAVALIGVGEDNTYGHPADSIRGALQDLGVITYRTDVHGSIVLSIEGDRLAAESLGSAADAR